MDISWPHPGQVVVSVFRSSEGVFPSANSVDPATAGRGVVGPGMRRGSPVWWYQDSAKVPRPLKTLKRNKTFLEMWKTTKREMPNDILSVCLQADVAGVSSTCAFAPLRELSQWKVESVLRTMTVLSIAGSQHQPFLYAVVVRLNYNVARKIIFPWGS